MVVNIASIIGNPKSPPLEEAEKWCKYARMRVTINVDNPLPNKVSVTLLNNVDIEVTVRYEQLSRLCFFCGRLGHDEQGCSILSELGQAIENSKSDVEKQQPVALLKFHCDDSILAASPA
uniref:Zinc knuckle CX2CX4HX4C domain-containing protein n=1 Tax=Nelumbo nucifera TaxID=4432 RepID=A0A822YGL0_NELNU|nr:TPA_asm: hypothetical protein HUJ06_031554 [Nelumbo nucifera]